MANNYNTGDTVVTASVDTAVLKTAYDAGTFLYASSDNTPVTKTVAETLALLGHPLRSTIHSDALRPTGAITESFSRDRRVENTASLSTGRLTLVAIHLDAGQIVTSITFVSGTTALDTGSNQWFALFSSARGKLAVTADDTNVAWAAHSAKTLTIASPYTVTASGLHYVGINVVATTVPSLVGCVGNNAATWSIDPALCGTSNTGLTDPASAPATADALTGLPVFPYAYVS